LFSAPQKVIWSFWPEGPVANNPEELVDELTLLLSGGTPTISTDKDIGLNISTPGEKMLVSSTDVEFHETPWGTSVGTFFKTGSFIQASGRIVLFPGIRIMNVEFDTLFMSSYITGDVDFNFNVDFKPQSAPKQPQSAPKQPQSAPKKPQSAPKQPQSAPKKPQSAPKQPQSAPKHPQSTPKHPQSAPKQPQTASSDDMVMKFRGKPISNLQKVTNMHGVQFKKPKGSPPTKFHPAPMWSTSKGDWYGWFDSRGKPAYKPRPSRAGKDLGKEAEAELPSAKAIATWQAAFPNDPMPPPPTIPGLESAAGGTKKRPREEEVIDDDLLEEAAEMMESEKEVGGFPVYKMSTGQLADGTYCELGEYSFCARAADLGIVRDSDSAVGACAYKIEEPNDLGKFLLAQTKMGFFCSKVNKSCGMTLAIGVEIEGVVYGVFRDTGTNKPQSMGINVDFIPNCITPLYFGILHSSVAIENPALEACINNWYVMSRLRSDSDEKWKFLSTFAELCEEDVITDWQQFQDPSADDDLEFDQTTFFEQPEVSAGEKHVFKPHLPFMNWLWEHYSFDPTEEAPISTEEGREESEGDEEDD
jgi:hypothetical protein